MKKQSVPHMSDQMRKAIEQSPCSVYKIAQASGVDKSTISKFLSGRSGLSMKAVDKIGSVLGWSLAKQEKPKRKRGR